MLGEIFGVDAIVVVVVALVLLFGGAAIPKLAKNLGSAKNQFQKGLEENKDASATVEPTTDSAVRSQTTVTATAPTVN